MSRSGLALTIGFAAEAVREGAPLVHCVVPRAATSFVADVLHGAGARSVVTGTTPDALAAMASADALVLDLGTLSAEWSELVNPSIGQAREAGVPWVLDATRLGGAPMRIDRVRALLGYRPSVVRVSAGDLGDTRLDVGFGAAVVGRAGAEVEFGSTRVQVPPGAALLPQIPGVRSAATALMAACATVTHPLEAALAGAAWLALASERAERGAGDGRPLGPASLRTALVDALWRVRGDEIAQYLDLR